MKLLLQRGNCLARLPHGVLDLLIDISALAAGLDGPVANLFQLAYALSDLLLPLALLSHLDRMIGLLLEFMQGSTQPVRDVIAHFTHLRRSIDALFHSGKMFSELVELH